MPIVYTEDQLRRETQLLLTEVSMLVDAVVHEGAGIRALGLDPQGLEADRHFEETLHPDDLVDLGRFEIWHRIRRIERYAKQQVSDSNIWADVLWLQTVLERTFSTEVVQDFAKERANHPRDEIPGVWEEGAGDVEFGHFHRGILKSLLEHGKARLKVDKGEPLTMSDIALLLDMREATVVTNAHRKKFATYEEENRRYALPEAVLPWMIKNGYLPTQSEAKSTPVAPNVIEDYLFIPAARDFTWFSPDCRINGRYTIGNHGEERRFTDYFTALAELNRLPTPRWRTKSPTGVVGIAWGVHFQRVRRAEIERVIASLTNSN